MQPDARNISMNASGLSRVREDKQSSDSRVMAEAGFPRSPLSESRTLDAELNALQHQEIVRVLEETRGRIYGPHGAAARLGLKPSTLQARMKRLGIDRMRAAVGLESSTELQGGPAEH